MAKDGAQVFVANPKKPPQIEAILRRNKDKLILFLRNFHTDRDDEQFNVRFFPLFSSLCIELRIGIGFSQDEKAFLLQQIEAL